MSLSVEPRKHLLIELGRPNQTQGQAPAWLTILKPLLKPLFLGISALYQLCFGWLERAAARKDEQRFADDIRTNLGFLFAENAATIVPNTNVPFPPSFDGASVTIALDNILLRFTRGRGDFSVEVASRFAPEHFEDFALVADGLTRWDTPPAPTYSLDTFATVLRPRLIELQQKLSAENFQRTLETARRRHNASVDRYTERLRQQGSSFQIITRD
jgi:hypothetical protein